MSAAFRQCYACRPPRLPPLPDAPGTLDDPDSPARPQTLPACTATVGPRVVLSQLSCSVFGGFGWGVRVAVAGADVGQVRPPREPARHGDGFHG